MQVCFVPEAEAQRDVATEFGLAEALTELDARNAEIEALKTRLATAEKERDEALEETLGDVVLKLKAAEKERGNQRELRRLDREQVRLLKYEKAELIRRLEELREDFTDFANSKEEIEGLKTRLAAVEKERDEAITARDTAASNYNAQIEGLRQRLESHKNAMLRAEIAVGRLEKERDRQRKEIEALKLELKIRLHAANSLLHGVEGERDRQKEELAHWKEANEQLLGACRSRDALLAAVEKERDQANARRSSHAKARDKWAKDHARQKKEIARCVALNDSLLVQISAAEKERGEALDEVAALNEQLQKVNNE